MLLHIHEHDKSNSRTISNRAVPPLNRTESNQSTLKCTALELYCNPSIETQIESSFIKAVHTPLTMMLNLYDLTECYLNDL